MLYNKVQDCLQPLKKPPPLDNDSLEEAPRSWGLVLVETIMGDGGEDCCWGCRVVVLLKWTRWLAPHNTPDPQTGIQNLSKSFDSRSLDRS